ncbi:MAG: NfeD family protein [Opitutaceae bacterium]|nr:NfeD family protein [Opitutaceae bacterium]
MNAIGLLFLSGVTLLAFEVIVPGAILGIFGCLALLAGVILSFTTYGAAGGMAALGIALLLVSIMLFVEFYLLPRTRIGRRMFLRTSIVASSHAVPEATLVGADATAETQLTPSGYVMIGGKRYDAFSQSGPVSAGEALRVVAVDSFRVIVTKP